MAKTPQHTRFLAAARVPPDRLLSGLLTVNVRNAYDNSDSKDDTNQAYYDHWGDIEDGSQKSSYPYGDERPLTSGTGGSKTVADPGRSGRFQTFADYDCFLFWVAGGMTLGSHSVGTSNAYSGSGGTDYGTLYSTITDPKCNSYVRSHLISRANNAYGHDSDGNTNYYKGLGIQRIETLSDDIASSGAVTTTYLADGTRTDYLYNNANYQDHSSKDDKYNLETASNNTFYSPVRDIQITGSHRFSTEDRTGSELNGYANTSGTFYQLNHHDTTFWTLKVSILLWGFEEGETNTNAIGDAGTADTLRTDYNINVFYQPFGETPELDFALTEWAS